MSEKQYNIIYYHGLDSSLSQEKRAILEKFGKVIAPTYDYRKAGALEVIEANFGAQPENTVLIGSSYGGFVAFKFSSTYDLPCLLFNPALPYRSIHNRETAPGSDIKNATYIVLGKNDEVIKCDDNLNFISRHLNGPCEVSVENAMAHQVPKDVFEKHVSQFFRLLNKSDIKSG